MAIEYVDRPPRILPELPFAEIAIPEPPEEGSEQQSILTLIVPLITVVGFLFVSGSGNPLMIIPMGLAMVLAVLLSIVANRQAQRRFKAKQKAYREVLAQTRQEVNRSHNVQRIFYHHNYPDVPSLLAIAARKEGSRFGARLWERRPTDSDFGAVRLGIGSRPSTVIYKFEQTKSPVEETDISRDARRLADDSKILTGVPITIPLRPAKSDRRDSRNATEGQSSDEEKDIAGRHSIGIYGRNRNNTSDFARAIVAHFTAFHSSTDSRLYVLGSPESEPSWSWTAWLPHCVIRTVGEEAAEPAKPKQLDQLCFSPRKEEVSAFWKRIKRELDTRQIRLRDTSDEEKALGVDVTLPFLLVVVDLLGSKADSPLASVASEAAVATINEHGPELGAAVIFLADDPTQIPSEAVAMTEVASVGDKVVFRYTEVGLNTPRYVGEADILSAADARQQYAARVRRLAIRQTFGADLPRSVNMLEMQSLLESRKIETVDKLNIPQDWQRSIEPANQEWLSVPIGVVSNQETRTLVFSAKEGGDGVHGMIAGTTGSGKSELLLTLIAGMAIKYDPRIVNFVLVDFKGGSAFEPFRRLPHVVDILTNLEANSVERMFVALHAVMAERASLLARSNAKDIVDYRKKVVPRLPPDSPLPRTFPHLFIIVDEFAEMIAANPEYKAYFESVTRLGRAFGVSLILSTQRPTGVVTDQMRANMKFRLCLRVETPDDSKELLGRPDAAFLANLGGRGYIQVGNDILTALQVARAGGDYSDERVQVVRDVVWLDEERLPSQAADLDQPLYSPLEIAEALGMRSGEMPVSMVDWIVGVCAIRAKRDGVPVQTKPWPDPLPVNLSLTEPVNAEYLNTERAIENGKFVINKGLQAWAANTDEKPLWQPIDWKSPPPLRADIGLVDNPHRAEQRLLTIDMTRDPVVVFGAAGRGKSTLIKSLLLALAAERTPNELHIYALDFGRGGLKALRSLPHLGASVDSSETSRVDQMIRMLRNMINERQEKLAKYASLADYNLRNPTNLFPEVVVVIDNFAEFRENFEHLIGELMALIRDGRAFGIYFVIATNAPGDLAGKLYNLLTQRLTMTQPDPSTYSDIVGSGAPRFDNVPGRGLVAVTIEDHPIPMEFHVGVPGSSAQASDGDRPDPFQELAERMERVFTAMGGKRPAAELPRSVNMLDMFSLLEGRKIQYFGELPIAENWRRSMMPEHQEWLRAPFGLISSKEVRTLVFQAQADGVHGMIAGTTGSGKSELLLTMIAAMGIKYDPRIVNFVLVDFKGGAAFEPFKKMPHVVDIATNLQGNAVERIFIAIRAEMDRRAKLLADGRVGDLVDYRRRVIPRLKPGDTLAPIFPHLFVVVDEFAEMVAANPEYRLQFESITRLGRAFGVTLVLSTQRPAGVVSDQMRANMKFRVCLRVETPEDSKELLGRPDAARLPQIGGRGYIQAGTEALTEVQVARSGGDYTDTVPDPVYPTEEILDALGLNPDNKPGLMIDWVVGALAAQAKRDKVPPLYKPWPDPLPKVLPLNEPVDANYIAHGSLGKTIVINPAVTDWMNNTAAKPIWPEVDWKAGQSIRTPMGIIDNPYLAEQRVLNIDLSSDPVLVLGAAGRGKTVFLKSLLLSLAAAHSPAALHIYVLDFGRGGLKSLRALPHVAGVVDAMEEERVERLLRMLRNTIDDRQQKTQAYDSLQDYNAKNPTAALPAVVVAIDNVSEFKETYEPYLADLISLVRDGRSFGISFIITAQMPNDVPGKLFGLLNQHMTFTLSDPSDYTMVMGRGWPNFNDEPGRGLTVELVNDRPQPLEFHTAIPVGEGDTDYYRELVQRMATAWATVESKTPAMRTKRPKTVEPLAKVIDLQSVLPPMGEGLLPKAAPIGVNDYDREPTLIELDAKGPHLILVGPPVTGKTTALRSLVLSLAHCYSPEQLAMVFIDPADASRRFYSFGGGGENMLENLPHVLQTVSTARELDEVVKRLRAEYDELVISRLKANKNSGFTPQDNQKRSIVVFVDNYDEAESLNKGEFGFEGLSLVGKGQKLHFVISGPLSILSSSGDEFRRRADSARYALVLQDFEAVRNMGVRGSYGAPKELPAGRGFLVKAVSASMMQCALPYVEGKEGAPTGELLNSWLAAIRAKYPQRAQWSYGAKDLAALEEAIHGEAGSIVAVTASAVAAQSTAMAELDKLMAMQADLAKQMAETEIPDATPATMAKLEVETGGKSPKKKKGGKK